MIHMEDTPEGHSKPSPVSSRKKFLGALFKKNPTNYISIKSVWNVEFHKIVLCFADCFPKAAEAVNNDRLKLRRINRYQIRSLIQNNCAVLSHYINLSKGVSILLRNEPFIGKIQQHQGRRNWRGRRWTCRDNIQPTYALPRRTFGRSYASDNTRDANDIEEGESDEDGLTAATLEARYERVDK